MREGSRLYQVEWAGAGNGANEHERCARQTRRGLPSRSPLRVPAQDRRRSGQLYTGIRGGSFSNVCV